MQRRIDNNRRAYVVDLCRALGIDRRRAQTFAELSMITLAGSQNLCRPVDPAMVGRVTDELVTQILAAAATSASGSPE